MRLTYRTARVLEALADCPGGSNRAVGERSGVPDQGQISRLLARLERLELAENSGRGHTRGEANAWTLTPTGRRVALGIGRIRRAPDLEAIANEWPSPRIDAGLSQQCNSTRVRSAERRHVRLPGGEITDVLSNT